VCKELHTLKFAYRTTKNWEQIVLAAINGRPSKWFVIEGQLARVSSVTTTNECGLVGFGRGSSSSTLCTTKVFIETPYQLHDRSDVLYDLIKIPSLWLQEQNQLSGKWHNSLYGTDVSYDPQNRSAEIMFEWSPSELD